MVNVLQGMSYIQQQGEMGRQRGTQNRLAALASQAYGAPAEERRGLVQQAIQADPTAGFALGQSLEQDRGQQMGQLSQKARMLVGYAKAGNQQGVQSLYPQLAAEAQQLGLGQGIPQQWDESYLPGIEQLAMMGGGGSASGVQSTYVDGDGNRVAIMRDGSQQVLGPNDLGASKQTITVTGPDGRPRQYTFDRRSGSYVPAGMDGAGQVPQGGAPGSAAAPIPQGQGQQFVDDSLALANQMISAGIPAEQVDSFLQQRLNQGGSPPQGAAQTPQAPAPSPQTAMAPQRGSPFVGRSPEEQAALTTAAQQSAELGFLPQRQAIETQGAVDRERAVGQVKADQEREAGRPKARLAMEQAKSRVERVDTLVDGIMPRVGYWTAGLMSLSSALPGTPAGDLRRDLGTLQAIAGFDELNAMRASSPTGGALGNVTERELAFLQSVVRNIENSQSPEQLRRNLAAFRNEVQGSWDRIERAYEEDYGQGSQGGRPSQRLRFNAETGRIE